MTKILTIAIIIMVMLYGVAHGNERYLSECKHCHADKTMYDWKKYLPKAKPKLVKVADTNNGNDVYILIIDGRRFLIPEKGGITPL